MVYSEAEKRASKKYYDRNKMKCLNRLKDWRSRNPNKVKEQKNRYYLKHKTDCLKRNHDHYVRNRKVISLMQKNIKRDVLTHYSGNPPHCQCPKCENPFVKINFLTIDHVNNNGREERNRLKKYGSSFYKWLVDMNFPEGYQVLCWNCNCGKGHNKGICPHMEDI